VTNSWLIFDDIGRARGACDVYEHNGEYRSHVGYIERDAGTGRYFPIVFGKTVLPVLADSAREARNQFQAEYYGRLSRI